MPRRISKTLKNTSATKITSIQKTVTTHWDNENDDELACPLDNTITSSNVRQKSVLNVCIRRKPITTQKCLNLVERHCDENVNKDVTYSPNKKEGLGSPKRKLFEEIDNSPSKRTCSPAKEKTIKTPSSLIKNLDINSDSTIKCNTHSGVLKPKSLFGASDTSYSAARQALHTSQPTSLPGREEQLQVLRTFLYAGLENRKGASSSLYISGAPGTGKTASINLLLEENKIKSGYKVTYINCTSVSTSRAIYSRVAQALQVKVHGCTEKDIVASIQKHITHSKKKILLLLDEVDQLASRNQCILYTIFEWPCLAQSQLTLIGIANSLDLTDRLLPRLQAHVSCCPRLLHYAPYSKQQINDIIISRLQQAGVSNVFKSFAVEMIAAKVAAVSGDARRALDIGRRVVELADTKNVMEKSALRQTSDHGSNTYSPRKSPRKVCSSETISVGIAEVRSVLDGVYGTSQSLILKDVSGDDGLPMQQKLLICSLLLMVRKGKNKEITVTKLYEVYSRVCGKRNLNSVPQSEIYSICTLLEDRGILRVIASKKETRLAKISLQWDDEEISAALCDKHLLSDILSDTSCLMGKF